MIPSEIKEEIQSIKFMIKKAKKAIDEGESIDLTNLDDHMAKICQIVGELDDDVQLSIEGILNNISENLMALSSATQAMKDSQEYSNDLTSKQGI